MNERITLKFQKLHLVTTLGWALILFFALISRGVLSSFLFWLLLVFISVLFVLDAIYFVTRVIEGHYVLITNYAVIQKQFLKPVKAIQIQDLMSITLIEHEHKENRVVLESKDEKMEWKLTYKFSKESMLASLQQSTNYPKDLTIHRMP